MVAVVTMTIPITVQQNPTTPRTNGFWRPAEAFAARRPRSES